MAKNLIANEGSLELHEDGVLKETYPKTLLHVKPISNNSVRVTLLDYKKLYFDLSKGDSVQGVVQSTIEDLLTEASKLSLDASGGGGSSEPVTWDTLDGKPATFPPTIGTTATTAKAGNYTPPNVTTSANGLMLATDKVRLDAIQPASVAPVVAGTATVGTSVLYARQDHVHPAQTSVSGNAGTATALATGRTFSLTGGATGTSAAFNGTANASIAVTLATPTSTVRGGVLQASAQADSTATDVAGLVTDFNALLAKLRTAGVIA